MSKANNLVDTNVLVRFLTQDNEAMAKAAGRLFSRAEENSLVVTDVVMAETVFVLKSVYEKEKDEIINTLFDLIKFKVFSLNRKLIGKTLELWGDENISFVDAYLSALVTLGKNKLIYSFDRRLGKVKGVEVEEPNEF